MYIFPNLPEFPNLYDNIDFGIRIAAYPLNRSNSVPFLPACCNENHKSEEIARSVDRRIVSNASQIDITAYRNELGPP